MLEAVRRLLVNGEELVPDSIKIYHSLTIQDCIDAKAELMRQNINPARLDCQNEGTSEMALNDMATHTNLRVRLFQIFDAFHSHLTDVLRNMYDEVFKLLHFFNPASLFPSTLSTHHDELSTAEKAEALEEYFRAMGLQIPAPRELHSDILVQEPEIREERIRNRRSVPDFTNFDCDSEYSTEKDIYLCKSIQNGLFDWLVHGKKLDWMSSDSRRGFYVND